MVLFLFDLLLSQIILVYLYNLAINGLQMHDHTAHIFSGQHT